MTLGAAARPAPPQALVFGHFELRPAERLLRVDGQPARLGARAFDVLVALAERRGRVVAKSELLDIVWPDTVVEENNLQVHVWALRKLLGADTIATVPGRGYRFTAVARGGEAPAPEPVTARATTPAAVRPTRPAAATALVGRDDERQRLAALLDAERLVSVVGPGGVGKTRLALQALADRDAAVAAVTAVAAIAPGSAVWVELGHVTAPRQLAEAVAAGLGVALAADAATAGLVAAAAQAGPLLLVLDNAEHLLDAVAALTSALLAGAPAARLLVTSQARLDVPGEAVFRLQPLAVPAATPHLASAMAYGAVALFVQRALAADHRFALTDANLAAVVEICARLDGMALAIELAASRVALLGPRRLAAALDERFAALGAARRGVPQRQSTLRAALEWSHGLLQDDERAAFRRLGVFRSGFTLEMAVALCAGIGGPAGARDGVELLAALVDRSLVATVGDGAEPRYAMLETPRAFALQALAAAGEGDAVERLHAEVVCRHFCALERQRDAGALGGDDTRAQLQPDLDNGRAALAWALAHDDAAALTIALTLAVPLALALQEHRHEQRRLWEATAALMDAADGAGPPPASPQLAAVQTAWALGCASFWAGQRPDECLRWAERAAAWCSAQGDRRGLYLALSDIVRADATRQSPRQLQALQALPALEDAAWPAWVRARGASAAQRAHATLGDLAAASAAAERLLRLAEQAGSASLVVGTLANLADLALAEGRTEDAVRHGRELEQRLVGSRLHMNLAFVRVNLAAALLAQGDLAAARQTALAAWPTAAVFDTRVYWADYLALLAALEQRPRCAALLLGHGSALIAAGAPARQANEAQAAARADALVRAALGDAAVEPLLASGAQLGDAAVAELAFATIDRGH